MSCLLSHRPFGEKRRHRVGEWRKAIHDRATLVAMRCIELQNLGADRLSRYVNAAALGANATPYFSGIGQRSVLLVVFILLLGGVVIRFMPHLTLRDLSLSGDSLALTFGAVFLGSVTAGIAGFAFSAITGALLFLWLPPTAAIPLLLACSITSQLFSVTALWRTMQWENCRMLLVGGLPGIPIGAYLLQNLGSGPVTAGFGLLVAGYATFMMLCPRFAVHRCGNRAATIAVGFMSGIAGGAAAFPGAIPTIWCSLRSLPKDVQRGTVQPFILAMQCATMLYFSRLGILHVGTLAIFMACAPAVLAGTWIGIRLYRRIDEAMFQRVLLVLLMISGVILIL